MARLKDTTIYGDLITSNGNLLVWNDAAVATPAIGSVIILGSECYTQGIGTNTTISTPEEYSTLKNPNAFGYNGVWKLIDKEFKIIDEYDISDPSTYFSKTTSDGTVTNKWQVSSSSTTATNPNLAVRRNGHDIWVRLTGYNKGAYSGNTDTLFGRLKPDAFGVTGFYNTYWVANLSGTDGVAGSLLGDNGDLRTTSFATMSTPSNSQIPAGEVMRFVFSMNGFVPRTMLDSHCEKFYWKRIG